LRRLSLIPALYSDSPGMGTKCEHN
jgi:hypothetical protein